MIIYKTGNMFACKVDAIVNTVNEVGVSGIGVALTAREAAPENYNAYRRACKRKDFHRGEVMVIRLGATRPVKYMINFATKGHWREGSRLEDIESGLHHMVAEVKRLGITSVALPPLGCGHGGLYWPDVERLIHLILGPIEFVNWYVYISQ